ncbi:MAG: PAS domain-containing protein [Bdellovibrionales bacterium]|nr:PAS domain-containing protein [Bdellovibrionales bacterium]
MGDFIRRIVSGLEPEERLKRRKEFFLVVLLSVVFLVLTFIEFRLFEISHSLPFMHSIFFLGLVNFNIIIFLLLIYFIFRNVVKVFVEKQGRLIGSSLKTKLIAAFVTFSFVPTALMFIVSVFYINNSFDKWFSTKMAGVLESSLEVTNAFSTSAKRKNYHFANRVVQRLNFQSSKKTIQHQLDQLREEYSLDAIEYYPSLFADRYVSLSEDELIPEVPQVSLNVLKRSIQQNAETSLVHQFDEGNLIRVIVPVKSGEGAVVVSTFMPLSLLARINDISRAYEDFRDTNPLEYPIKSIYLIILTLMTLVILLGATWFGFYLAKQLSIPLLELGIAATRVAKKDYQKVYLSSGSQEINELIEHFNNMTDNLERSERIAKEANQSLKETLSQLDEHSQYIEVVLSNVMTGVISIDQSGYITMVNRHAANLLNIDPEQYVGRKAKDVLSSEYYHIFEELLTSMKQYKAQNLKREVQVNIGERTVPLQMTLSVLYDDAKNELGKVLVFDDLTPLVSAQRAAAWTEVARRIAHEIKNPLTPIRLSAQRLQKKFGTQVSDPAFEQCTNMIIDQVDSLKGLVNEFSHFARLPKSQPIEANLNSVIADALALYTTAHVDISFKFQEDINLPRFRFDPEQMKRVISNLLDNAVAALKETKEAKVDIRIEYDSILRIVRVSVIDNGPGISRNMRDRIFEPYVTSKESGTGLGLAIVKRTIEDHNGFIRAYANEPTGTKIIIELPVIGDEFTKAAGSTVRDLDEEPTI